MEKVMEFEELKRIQTLSITCVVLIITGKDLLVPIWRVQNVSCWNGNSEEPGGPAPHPLFLDQTEAQRVKKNFWRLPPPTYLRAWMAGTPPSLKVWICHCNTQNNPHWKSFHKEIGENISLLFAHFSLPFPAVGSECHIFYLLGVGKSVIECIHILYFNISQLSKEELGMLPLLM